MAELQPTDLFLVNRSNVASTVSTENLMATILDDDLMIVNRGDVVSTITGADVKESLGNKPINPSPDEITSSPDFQSGTGIAGDPYILETQVCSPAGSNLSSIEEITIAIPGASDAGLVQWTVDNTRFTQPDGITDLNGVWTGRLVYNDTPDTTVDQTYVGNLQIGTTYFRWSVEQKVLANSPPDLTNVSLIEGNPSVVDGRPYQNGTIDYTGNTSQLSGDVNNIWDGTDTTKWGVRFDSNSGTTGEFIYNIPTPIDASTVGIRANTVGTEAPITISLGFADGTFSAGQDASIGTKGTLTFSVTQPVTKIKGTGSIPSEATNLYTYETYADGKLIGLPLDGRFTSQSFVASTQVTEGEPVSEKTFVAHVDGTLSKTVKFDEPLESSAVDSSGVWTGSKAPENNDWRAIAYGNNKFVALSNGGTNPLMYSEDGGSSWTPVAGAEPTYEWLDLTYGDGKFVAVSGQASPQGKKLMYSTDGINWTSAAAPTYFEGRSVGYGELPDGTKRYVALQNQNNTTGSNGLYSDDGITWLGTAGPVLGSWGSVAYGNGKFVAVASSSYGGNATIMHSSDGISWDAGVITGANANSWSGVAFGNGMFVVVGQSTSNNVLYSYDGINWLVGNNPSSLTLMNVAYGDNKFVATGYGSNNVAYSTDGINWAPVEPAVADCLWYGITYGENKFVAVGNASGADINNIVSSATGTGQVLALTFATDADMEGLAAGDTVNQTNNFTEPLESSIVDTSGAWLTASAPEPNQWYSVTYGDDKFVAVAQNGTNQVMYSTDGISSWTAAAAPEANDWRSVTYGETSSATGGISIGTGLFVAVSTVGTYRVMYSTNGSTWLSATAVQNNEWISVTYGNGRFVAIAQNGTGGDLVMYSTDGINWVGKTPPEANSWTSVTYGGGTFVAVSQNGTHRVMYSTNNGFSWDTASAANDNWWQSVTYGNGKFVAVSLDGDKQVMYSTDGISWTEASASDYSYWYSVTYGDGKFVATASGGENRVMYSTDGINWTSTSATDVNNWYAVTYGDGKFVSVAYLDKPFQVMYSATGTGTTTDLNFATGTDMSALEAGDTVSSPGYVLPGRKWSDDITT